MEQTGKAALLLIRLGLDVQQRIAGGIDGVPQSGLIQRVIGEDDAGTEKSLRMASLMWDSHIPHIIPSIFSVVWIMDFLLIRVQAPE